jgi:hypothetical protein
MVPPGPALVFGRVSPRSRSGLPLHGQQGRGSLAIWLRSLIVGLGRRTTTTMAKRSRWSGR